MAEMFLKPYKPIARRRTDLFTYFVRFICGSIVGVLLGGFIAFRSHGLEARSLFVDGDVVFSTSFYLTLLLVTIITGLISAILGDAFWGMFSGKRSY